MKSHVCAIDGPTETGTPVWGRSWCSFRSSVTFLFVYGVNVRDVTGDERTVCRRPSSRLIRARSIPRDAVVRRRTRETSARVDDDDARYGVVDVDVDVDVDARAREAWDAEKASVAARAGTAAGMAAAERRRSGSPDGDAGGSSADAVERASSRASEELNARAAKAASALPGLAQIKDAVAAADVERAAAAGGSDECGVLGGGGTRVASEEFPPGVAERLVARGASFDGAFFDGASPSSSRRRRGRPSRIAGSEAATDALERLLPVLEDSERALDAVRSRSRGILKDAVDRRFGRDRLVSTHGWE